MTIELVVISAQPAFTMDDGQTRRLALRLELGPAVAGKDGVSGRLAFDITDPVLSGDILDAWRLYCDGRGEQPHVTFDLAQLARLTLAGS